MAYPSVQHRDMGRVIASGAYMTDVSAPSSTYIPSPARGQLVECGSVINGAITGSNSTITVKVNGVAVPGLAWTITAAGSAPGDVDSAAIAGVGTGCSVVEGDAIQFVSDGASSTTASASFYAIVKRT